MASFDNIAKIIADLKVKGSSKGVSRQAIKAALGDGVSAARVNNCLKKAVAAGKLIAVKGSFKLAAAPKKVGPVWLFRAASSRVICPLPLRLPRSPPPSPTADPALLD